MPAAQPAPGTITRTILHEATCRNCGGRITSTGVGWWHDQTSLPTCPAD